MTPQRIKLWNENKCIVSMTRAMILHLSQDCTVFNGKKDKTHTPFKIK